MKKIFALGIVVLAISLVFTACSEKGGTLKLVNDEASPYNFRILFDGKDVRVNDGATVIQPSQTIQAHSDVDTSYVVYSGSAVLWTGTLSGGETVVKKFSTLP